MTFSQQLSEAADAYAPFKTKPAVNICAANEGFRAGYKACLNSELIKELHDTLLIAKIFIENFSEGTVVVEEVKKTLQKLKEARGESRTFDDLTDEEKKQPANPRTR